MVRLVSGQLETIFDNTTARLNRILKHVFLSNIKVLLYTRIVVKCRESECTAVLVGVSIKKEKSYKGVCLMHKRTWGFLLNHMHCICSSCGHARGFDDKRWDCFAMCSHLHRHACTLSQCSVDLLSGCSLADIQSNASCVEMNLYAFWLHISCTNALFLLCIILTGLYCVYTCCGRSPRSLWLQSFNLCVLTRRGSD